MFVCVCLCLCFERQAPRQAGNVKKEFVQQLARVEGGSTSRSRSVIRKEVVLVLGSCNRSLDGLTGVSFLIKISF